LVYRIFLMFSGCISVVISLTGRPCVLQVAMIELFITSLGAKLAIGVAQVWSGAPKSCSGRWVWACHDENELLSPRLVLPESVGSLTPVRRSCT
jgi:hypothetical protein